MNLIIKSSLFPVRQTESAIVYITLDKRNIQKKKKYFIFLFLRKHLSEVALGGGGGGWVGAGALRISTHDICVFGGKYKNTISMRW